MSRRILGFVAFAALTLTASQAASGQCGYEECWGAIGFDGAGNIGVSYSQWSEQRAYELAQEQCAWNCAEMRTFKNTCAAIAQGENGSWSWAKGRNRSGAEQTAHRLCGNRTHSCKTVVWACSN